MSVRPSAVALTPLLLFLALFFGAGLYFTAQGEAMKAAIIAQAEKTAEQITASAKKTAENEINAAIGAMRAEMAEHIVAATEKLLAQKLSASEHTKLIDKYLTKVVLN